MSDAQQQPSQVPRTHEHRPWYRRWQWWGVGALVLVAATAGIASALAWTSGPGPGATSGATAGSSTTTQATTDLATPIAAALTAEREAEATYENVIARFGAVQPFARVRAAEARHVATMEALAERYGVQVPSGSFTGLAAPETIAQACQLGATTEQDLVTMYGQLRTQTSQRDVTRAFANLQAAARDDHLPAFERCASTTGGTTGGTSGTTPTAATPTAALTAALGTAATTEQETEATYENVIARFGAVQPFATVRAAEAQHVATVEALAGRYGVSLPSGPFTGLAAPATITQACQLAVTAEQETVAMYDLLIPRVSGYADVTQAFTNLQAAARDSHLPAFERCA